jgi:hypothetical protein
MRQTKTLRKNHKISKLKTKNSGKKVGPNPS